MEKLEALNSSKRQRMDNFDAHDTDLLLSLIEEYIPLIDSGKIKEKEKGWEAIHKNFNEKCKGLQRDMGALKMKLKNIKASSRRSKPETNLLEMVDNESNGDDEEERVEFKIDFPGKRKRCKKFRKADCDLLITLYDKYCTNLDNSTSIASVKRRTDAWDKVFSEFNRQQKNDPEGIERELSELKIKIKNLKALRIKIEPNDSNDTSSLYEDSIHNHNQDLLTSASTPIVRNLIPAKRPQKPHPIKIVASTSKSDIANHQNNHQDSLLLGNTEFYDEFEVEYVDQGSTAAKVTTKAPTIESEIDKIRKENLLIKNSVLKKKERLLELQIALAERSLRRQM